MPPILLYVTPKNASLGLAILPSEEETLRAILGNRNEPVNPSESDKLSLLQRTICAGASSTPLRGIEVEPMTNVAFVSVIEPELNVLVEPEIILKSLN